MLHLLETLDLLWLLFVVAVTHMRLIKIGLERIIHELKLAANLIFIILYNKLHRRLLLLEALALCEKLRG